MNDLEVAFKEYREASNNLVGELLNNREASGIDSHKAVIACYVIDNTGNCIADLLNIRMGDKK